LRACSKNIPFALSPSTACLQQALRINFTYGEVEGPRRAEGEAFSLRSKKGFDFAQPERTLN
jgi:hypothetical protein